MRSRHKTITDRVRRRRQKQQRDTKYTALYLDWLTRTRRQDTERAREWFALHVAPRRSGKVRIAV